MADDPSIAERAPLHEESSYSFWTPERIRFHDVDQYGHVYYVAFDIFCETGRVAFAAHVGPGSLFGEKTQWVIARLVIDFLGQAYFPGDVQVGTRVLRIGRSSVTLGQGLFENGRCFATSEAVLVLIDRATGRSVPLPEEVRQTLAGLV